MPGFDKTGPQGMGSMTGGGRGYCAMPAGKWFIGRGRASCFGRSFNAFGRGRAGPGLGRRAFDGCADAGSPGSTLLAPLMTEEQELAGLRQQAKHIQGELEQIQRRISEMEQ